MRAHPGGHERPRPTGGTKEIETLAGLQRAFREWAASGPRVATVYVAGATVDEGRLLALLGGIAAAIAGDSVAAWQEPLRSWAMASPTPPSRIVNATREALGRDEDALAALYNASISSSNRRRLGTVFTPQALVNHMLDLAQRELGAAPGVVVDPGAGVGAFTIAAARRWPTARVVSVDVNVVTLGLLAARLAFENGLRGLGPLRRVELVHADYLDVLPSLFDQGSKEAVLVVGNPPYTRVQELPKEDRLKARRLAGEAIDNGHANLAMLIQAATVVHMRPIDVSCLALPGSFSYTRASRALRSSLWNSRRALAAQQTSASARTFTGRLVHAAVLLVGKERPRRTPLRLARLRIDAETVEVVESWTQSRPGPLPDNWFSTAAPVLEDSSRIPLGEVATVHRGTATGGNNFFFLDNAMRDALPAEVVVAAVPTLRDFFGLELTEDAHAEFGDATTKRWILVVPPNYVLRGALARYVARHAIEMSARHLPSQRTSWYTITDLPRPQILVSPLSSTAFKIVINAVGAVPSNNLLGITMRNGTAPGGLATWLRSRSGQAELLRLSRQYPGGSRKLEPTDLRAVRIPKSVLDSG